MCNCSKSLNVAEEHAVGYTWNDTSVVDFDYTVTQVPFSPTDTTEHEAIEAIKTQHFELGKLDITDSTLRACKCIKSNRRGLSRKCPAYKGANI